MNRPPDPFDLELHALGAIEDPARAAEIEAARAGALRGEHVVQQAWAHWWATRRPPFPVPRSRPRAWVRPVIAVAASLALVLAVVGLGALRPQSPIRAMGSGLPADVAVLRGGQPVSGPWVPLAGDALAVAFVPGFEGFADVVVVGADGDASVLAAGMPVSAGRRAALGGRAVLDDDRDREWLIVSIGPRARTEREAADAALGLLPDPVAGAGPDRFVLEITRGGE